MVVQIRTKAKVKIELGAELAMRLDFVGAWAAGLQLAVLALEDVPVRSGVAHGADPLDEGRLRLEEVEAMVAVTGDRHCVG